MVKLPDDPRPVINALVALVKRDGKEDLLNVLEQADPSLEWYEEDFGVQHYQLVLALPFDLYATVESKTRNYEELLSDYAKIATRSIEMNRSVMLYLLLTLMRQMTGNRERTL